MPKTPDETKKGLVSCISVGKCWTECPYFAGEALPFTCIRALSADALALIQQLQAELEDMTARYKIADDCAKKKGEMNEKLYAELTAVKAERDAAVADVKSLCATNYFSGDFCAYCKHNEPDEQCHHPCKPYSNEWGWEWRGVQKEGTK